MTKQRPTVEQLLARLAEATHEMRELRDADGQPERAWEIVKERGWISRELAERAANGAFGSAELEALGEAIRGGEQVRQALVVRRETAREQARELRAARRVQSGFQPYRETSGGHVAVDV
jgi:hypothetical protein